MRQSLRRVLSPHTCSPGGTPFHSAPHPLPLPYWGLSAGAPGTSWEAQPLPPALPASGATGTAAPGLSPASPTPHGPPPPTGGLAHAQTEAASEGAVPEVHRRAVVPGVGASGRAQPQREVPALEAALFQPHAGLQGGPPAAQASGRQHQHHVAARPGAPGGGRGGAQAGRGSWRAAGRERGTGLRNSRAKKPAPLRGGGKPPKRRSLAR